MLDNIFKIGSFFYWLVESINSLFPIVGTIKTVRIQSPADHGAWVLCDNRKLDQAEYPDLYAVLGDYYNSTAGAGVDEFGIPFDNANSMDHYHDFIYTGVQS